MVASDIQYSFFAEDFGQRKGSLALSGSVRFMVCMDFLFAARTNQEKGLETIRFIDYLSQSYLAILNDRNRF
ncbi:hypothetical protein ACM44_12730 [Chryseobacterium koreense CCUG 49689]|uniref:Uncharacterized protein n=1 Tax=Chryseobacterium koreense CCUG 49689 TaxID=1304281 RepID=A0A0J7IWZ4_9FLAO|nr:hypothetical protein ACM44_12730 [Chryseobacterium koreense CCUG 49689]